MTTHFITAEIDLQENPTDLPKAIEQELEKRDEEVLRWAITAVDGDKATVEAIALTAE
ncbi:hypothetical protein [Picosynechococcus sp. NKBG15041c]|uniref:hypothetical protein n=1 Tax=Picosynechococcus sp. NKBG15041c TaxID=1407650 RepID=UPI0003FB1263|nr:hypothetical protein [Picosynechococcus sp. NKBG15041c]